MPSEEGQEQQQPIPRELISAKGCRVEFMTKSNAGEQKVRGAKTPPRKLNAVDGQTELENFAVPSWPPASRRSML